MAISKRLRYQVLARDNFTCRYCGRSAPVVALEADHVIPRKHGGRDTLENLVAACEDCNNGKSDLMLAADVIAYITGEDELDPAISRGRGDLARELLGDLDPRDRDRLLAKTREEWNLVPEIGGDEDQVHIFAVYSIWNARVGRVGAGRGRFP